MIKAIESGWTDSETVHVDGFNRAVEVSVLFSGSRPERVSVRTDDDQSSLSIKAVEQTLAALGFAAASVVWEAGEAEREGVAFLRGVTVSE